MSRAKTRQPPTDEEILAYSNVPVEVASKYIGWSTPTLYYALQQERAPFGIAAQNPETGSWAYNISPGLLVRYKHGELQAWKLSGLMAAIEQSVRTLVTERMEAAKAQLTY